MLLQHVAIALLCPHSCRFQHQGPCAHPSFFATACAQRLPRHRARNLGCECFRVGGVADHVHLAIRISRTITIAQLVEELKTSSSKWLKTQSTALAAFAWQGGYGAFSIGPASLEALKRYIDTQEEHHWKRTFQQEYRRFLEPYGVDYDERYVWS
jgi:putative transposase